MMKHVCLALTLSLAVSAVAGAQDRIAVLDTELPKGMDTKVVIPITEKIMEEFVRSKLFVVLDRSFIAKTLTELEFSTSDLTAGDADKLATIGGFLKATYIVVSTVQKLDTRYFLSAKMIEVKSGVIMAQSSVDRDGSITVLIDMAGELGRKLVAAAMGQDVAAGKPGKTAPAAPTPEPSAIASSDKPSREPSAKPSRFSTVTGDYGTGATIATMLGNQYDIDLFTGSTTSFDAVSGSAYGVSGFLPIGLFYIAAGFMATDTEYAGVGYTTFTQLYNIKAGLGIDIPIGPVLTYAGITSSYLLFDWYEDGASYFTGSWSGVGYGAEVGGQIRFGIFALGLRYAFDVGTLTELDEYWVDLDLATYTLALRIGLAL